MKQDLIEVYASYFMKKRKIFNKNYANESIIYDTIINSTNKKYSTKQLQDLSFYLSLPKNERALYESVLEADLNDHLAHYQDLTKALNQSGISILTYFKSINLHIEKMQKQLEILPFIDDCEFDEIATRIHCDLEYMNCLVNECATNFGKLTMATLHNSELTNNTPAYPTEEIITDIKDEAKNLMNKAKQLDHIKELDEGFYISQSMWGESALKASKVEPEVMQLAKNFKKSIYKMRTNLNAIDYQLERIVQQKSQIKCTQR